MAQIGSTNVSMDTIKTTLENGGGAGLTNDLLTFFTVNAKINPWSKYKPIYTGYVNDAFLDINSSHFADANYGLTAPTTNSETTAWYAYKKVINNNDFSSLQWGYTLPSGGSASPYRLGDFRLYNPNATSPFYELSCDKGIVNKNEQFTIEIYNRYGSLGDGQVALSEMTDYHGYYAGVLIGKAGTEGRAYYLYTSSGTISSHHGVLSISGCRISEEGTYYMAPVLCQWQENTSVEGIQSNNYILLPVRPIKIVCENAVTSTWINCSASLSSNGDLFVTATLANGTSSSLTFTNPTIQIGYEGSTGTGTKFTGQFGNNYTVTKYSKTDITKTFYTSGLFAEAEQGKLYYRMITNGGSYVSSEKQLGINL